jgi:hypothetical protein
VISAAEALCLACARLTDQEKIAAALLEVEIEAHIKAQMEFGGCNGDRAFRTAETSGNVVAAVNQKLRRQGWITNWTPTYGQPVKGERSLTGWQLQLTPTDAAYAEAEALEKN